ncbi:MAG TPA: MFS transporter [Acidothermaceae bacterium]
MTNTRSAPTVAASQLRWVLGLTSAAYFMVVLDALVVTTALPRMQRDLHANLASLQWTVNSYGIAFAAGIITAAALGDRFGRRRVFNLGLALFTLASAACALAPNASDLVVARTIQGLGAAAVLPLSLTILTTAFPPARRGLIVGIYGGLAGLAVATGPLVGGVVTEGLDWHWIFWLNVRSGCSRSSSGFDYCRKATARQSGSILLALSSSPRASLQWSGPSCGRTMSDGRAPRSSRRW